MVCSAFFMLLVLTPLSEFASAQTCDPTVCKLPNCRCCTDKEAPGKLDVKETPQIIMLSFEGTITRHNVKNYQPLLDLNNPNGCKASATFFIEDEGSEYAAIKALYDEGHEIGIHSVDGKPAPTSNSSQYWGAEFKKIVSKLTDIGVKKEKIQGVRLPELLVGGEDEFTAITNNGLKYDSTCSNIQYSDPATFRWPCTFDFVYPNMCTMGTNPTMPHPGIWEVMVTDLHELTPEKGPCIVPSACRGITTKTDAFDLFFNAFTEHMNGARTPFNMVIDPAWPTNDALREGTIEFLQYVRVAFEDEVWVVSISKALDWVQSPTSIADLKNFDPWKC